QGNGAGWTHLGSRSRVLPFVEVEARSSAKAFGDLSGLGRIVYGYYSRAGRLLKNLEHRLPVRPRVGKIETLVDHRKIRNDVSLDRFHQRWPVVERGVLDLAAFEMIVRPGANPMDDFPAPSFNGAQCTAVWRDRRHGHTELPLQSIRHSVPNDANGFVYLIDANLHPVPNISGLVNRDTERVARIRGVRVIAPHVEIDSRGASSHAHDAQVPCLVGPQDSCLFQTITGGFGGINQTDQIPKFACEEVQRLPQHVQLRWVPAPAHSTDVDHASQQAAASHLLVQSDQRLLEPAGVGIRYDEANIVCNGPDVGDMIADALQVQQDGPHRQTAERHFNIGRTLDGLTESRTVGKTRISRNALRQKNGFVYG